jgi:YidC/Oxa1 family membrane protein insertase
MQRNPRNLVLFVVLYLIMLGVFYSTMRPGTQQPQIPPAQAAQILRAEAEKLEQEAVRLDTERRLDESRKKFHDAIGKYQQIANVAPKQDAGIDARVQIARIHDRLQEFDQAEQIYKDLAKQFPRRTAAITLDGKKTPTQIGNWANEKVAAVQQERAYSHRNHILYQILDILVRMTGSQPGFSYWFALFFLTVVIKIILYPVSKAQYKSMQAMASVAPLIKEAQEKLKGRPADEIHRRTMAIYKENNVNLAGGCMPAIIQMVMLIPLYNMVRYYEFQFRQGTFAWIGSALSHEYPQWLARNLAEFDIPLCILYIISFYLTSKITPMSYSADPQQQQQQKIMSIMMPLMFGYFMFMWRWPAAFTFYWLVLNIISTAQQYRIIKQYAPAITPSATPKGTEELPADSSSRRKSGTDGDGKAPGGNGRSTDGSPQSRARATTATGAPGSRRRARGGRRH